MPAQQAQNLSLAEPEEWVLERLFNTLQVRSDPGVNNEAAYIRYESSLYGPLIAYLHPFFPSNRHFLIKPQSTLRRTVVKPRPTRDAFAERRQAIELDDTQRAVVRTPLPDNLVPRESVDSYDSKVSDRSRGREVILIPDFVVVKGTAKTNLDKLVLIVEVKRDTVGLEKSRLQIQSYLQTAAKKHRRDDELTGLLILGKDVEIYHLNGPNKEADVLTDGKTLLTTGTDVMEKLRSIANKFSNEVGAEAGSDEDDDGL